MRIVGVAVFPARAGMSPRGSYVAQNRYCVPRASGDEPGRPIYQSSLDLCSPRERG